MSMLRPAVLLAASLALTSCATRSASADHAAPIRPDPAACARPAETPKLPDGAGVPLAVTDDERAALDGFLGWVRLLVDHDRALAAQQSRTAASPLCQG